MLRYEEVQAPRDATLSYFTRLRPDSETTLKHRPLKQNLDTSHTMAQDYSEYLAINVLNEQQLVSTQAG